MFYKNIFIVCFLFLKTVWSLSSHKSWVIKNVFPAFKKCKQILLLKTAWRIMCIKWCPQQYQVIALDFISFQSRVDMFLINKAFVLHHKITEEYPSNANELCLWVNYYVTFDHHLVLRLEAPILSSKFKSESMYLWDNSHGMFCTSRVTSI